MTTTTANLGLFKYQSGVDANRAFNIEQALNQNWDIIDNYWLSSAHNLFDFKWVDHELTDQSWLKADTFSWQDGTTYSTAYNHLVSDISSITAQTETIGSYTVTFYRAMDGHKVCLADQEGTVNSIYTESGISWYYILDTTNTRFKLPRTKFGFEGLRTNVGDKIDVDVLLPNITGRTGKTPGRINTKDTTTYWNGALGRYTETTETAGYYNSTTAYTTQVVLDASRSSSVYSGDGTNTKIQEPATQMYLYFYVGEFTETATQQTAGLNASLFNNKADLTAVDGQWVASSLTIDSSASIHTTTYNLGTTGTGALNYLPSDFNNYAYEVLIDVSAYTTLSSDAIYEVKTGLDDATQFTMLFHVSSNKIDNIFILPVKSGKIQVSITDSAINKRASCALRGYRRLGTNP